MTDERRSEGGWTLSARERKDGGRESRAGTAASGHATPRELIDRTRARAWALQIHYRWESGGAGIRGEGSLKDALAETLRTRRVSKRRLPRIRRLLTTLDQHLDEVDRTLQACLDNWRLERVSVIDRGILRLGATELLYLEDIPPRATIQEAVRLAGAYGGNESPRFVNGVLDALYKRADPGAGG